MGSRRALTTQQTNNNPQPRAGLFLARLGLQPALRVPPRSILTEKGKGRRNSKVFVFTGVPSQRPHRRRLPMPHPSATHIMLMCTPGRAAMWHGIGHV